MGPGGPRGEPVLHRPPAGLTAESAAGLVAAGAPEVDLSRAVAVEGGWDSFVLDTGEWIFKFPRRAEVERTLRAEIALLPALAEAAPLRVPRYEIVVEDPAFFAAYRKIQGAPLALDGETERAGRDLGKFLAALHSFSVEAARDAGVPGDDWRARQESLVAELESNVSPLLSPAERAAAHDAFEAFLEDDASFEFEPALVHYDIGPTHLLADDAGSLQAVIDWGDAWIGDPAADLAWALHGASPAFAAGVVAAYPGTADEARARALHYHRLGPWHEVVHGLGTGDDAWVRTGLAGVRERLPREPGRGR